MDGQKDQGWGHDGGEEGTAHTKIQTAPESCLKLSFVFCTVQETKNLAFATSGTLIFHSVIKH